MTGMADTLCAYPWTHVFVSNTGRQLPCCFAQGTIEEIDTERREASNLHGLWNSPLLRELRLQMIRGRVPSICAGCFKTEEAGRCSPRQDANSVQAPGAIEELVRVTRPDGSLSRGFRSIDLRLGNECNLRCRMCTPHSSKKLIPEWSQTGNPEMMRFAQANSEQTSWGTRDVWEWLLESGTEVESIHFAGGEPTLIGAHHDFLRKLITCGRAGRIRLSYSTNLTRILPNLENYLAHFREIHMIGSLDGHGKLNRYIRFPTKWDQVIRNLEALDELASRKPTLLLDLHTTVQAYNLTRIAELLRFIEESKFERVPTVPYFTPVEVPSYFNPRVLSPALKVMARDRFLEFMEVRESKRASRKAAGCEKRLDDLGRILNAAIEESSPRDASMFVQITRFFDQKRNHKLIEVVPEFEEMFGLDPSATPASAPDLADVTLMPVAQVKAVGRALK